MTVLSQGIHAFSIQGWLTSWLLAYLIIIPLSLTTPYLVQLCFTRYDTRKRL
ncbi:DUF2798 domain-containing protein [Lactococcus piscium]|uniref:DUF2798 domain-containing protein n=2 Tax=Pseudolactococcus carnosus TaxID=2749961 RepID=A0ABT0AUN7_9LACT|nr:DUF2798 domain-containing protein [Lactococcus carnosus]MCJ1976028.1 DUF2798 domain-containing protein [Lactococcus carnosus]MCJ1990451.1 DUF2798 domain-containing protein [Lactococcus carnosus]MCJ2000781.1 DUF2798 domain-containing protein [Lactococcus carnosus]MCJ2003086.1 DUF2798 domain-containing protein [Lactococcus carnosus]